MPTYEYKCTLCKKHFEVDQRVTEKPLTVCPKKDCKGLVARQISRTTFILKGTGWAKDGY